VPPNPGDLQVDAAALSDSGRQLVAAATEFDRHTQELVASLRTLSGLVHDAPLARTLGEVEHTTGEVAANLRSAMDALGQDGIGAAVVYVETDQALAAATEK
jgi:hypothetical protein